MLIALSATIQLIISSHVFPFSNISLIVNPLDNSSDFEAGDSETQSLTCSAGAPSKVEMNCNEATCLSQPTALKEGYYSSCEEETDESYSETESERHEDSVERDSQPQTCDIKRFSGDCDRVVDVLTEHDRTKNRKTYQVSLKPHFGRRRHVHKQKTIFFSPR